MRKFTMVLCAVTMLLCYACKEQTVPAIIDDNPQKNVAISDRFFGECNKLHKDHCKYLSGFTCPPPMSISK